MLITISKKYLHDLQAVLQQIKPEDYNKSLKIFDNGTIGKHVRHVLEFYQLLFSNETEIICYDNRERNLCIEQNERYACDLINEICDKINGISINKRVLLKSIYGSEEVFTESSFLRELAYNIEHTVHHLAIIKIGIVDSFSYINIPLNFGYADSTVQYLNAQKKSA